MSEQAVIETIEENVDEVVEAVVPEVYSFITAIKGNKGLVIGAVAVGVGIGATAGYFLAKKHLRTKYDDILAEEIEAAKNFYAAMNKDQFQAPVPAQLEDEEDDSASSSIVEEDAKKAFVDYSGGSRGKIQVVENGPDAVVVTETTESQIVEHNIFLNGSALDREAWDQDVEESKRTENFPYIISADEFFENEHDYDQHQLTYYAGDNTIVDDSDNGNTLPDHGVVGEENLSRFGHGSNDQHLVYIRNPRKELEFEIALSEGKYAEEVMGFDGEEDDDDTAPVVPMRSRNRNRGDDD
jgi:hypothetical protein